MCIIYSYFIYFLTEFLPLKKNVHNVQNSAARIVTQERLQDHDSMSRALIGLHWLPVDKRIEYKLLLYTYKALHDLAPGIFVNWLCRMRHVKF